MRKTYGIMGAALLGALAAMGTDCLDTEACTSRDLPNCNHYGESIIGLRPDCECVLFGVIIEDIYGSSGGGSGSGHFNLSASPGWTILGVSAEIDSVSLTTRSDAFDEPVTSQPLVIEDQTRVGGNWTFELAELDPSIVAISDQSDLALNVAWDGAARVYLRNPQGKAVNVTLDPRAVLAVTMSDDCDTRTLDGMASFGPLNLAVEASFTSPGC